MAEHKSPYTGEQVDKMLDTTNFTLFPALAGIGPNLDENGNENLSYPTNNPSENIYGGTFNEFKAEIIKLLDRSYLKDYFIKNNDGSITINRTKLFKQKNTEELMFFDSNGNKIFGISQSGKFSTFFGGNECMRVDENGIRILRFSNTVSNGNVAAIDTNGVIGKVSMSYFAKATELETVKAIAEGASVSYAFNTVAELDSWIAESGSVPINDPEALASDMKVGTNLYIINEYESDYWWDGIDKQPLTGDKSMYQRSNKISVYGGDAKNYEVVFIHPLPSENYIIQFSAEDMLAKFKLLTKSINGFVVEITPNTDVIFNNDTQMSAVCNIQYSNDTFYSDPLNYDLGMNIQADIDFDECFIQNTDGTMTSTKRVVGTVIVEESSIIGNVETVVVNDEGDEHQYTWRVMSNAVISIFGHNLINNFSIGGNNNAGWKVLISEQSFYIDIPANTIIPRNHMSIVTSKNFGGYTINTGYNIQGVINLDINDELDAYTSFFTTNKISM